MAVRYFLIGSETKRGQWNKVIFWTSNLMITRSVACTSCPADAHFSGSHHAFNFPWTLFLRRPDYLRAWHGLETVVYSQATQHVAWENSPAFLDATTPPLPPPPARNDQWPGTQTCVSRNRVLKCDVIKMKFLKLWDLSGYSERTMSKRPTYQKRAFRGKLSLIC